MVLGTSHYIVRPGRTTMLPSGGRVQAPGRLVPLVAVDRLPPWLEIAGVPRRLTPEQAMTMIAVGGYDDGVGEAVVEGVGEEAGRRGHTTDDGDDDPGKRDKRDEHTTRPQENTHQDDKGPGAAAALDVRVRQPDAAEAGDLDSTDTNTVFPVFCRTEGLESKAAAGVEASVASAAPAPALAAPVGDTPASSNEANIAPRTTTISATTEPPTKLIAPPPRATTPAKDDGGLPSDKSNKGKGDTAVDRAERSGNDVQSNETEDAYASSSSSSFDALDAFARVLTSRSSSLTAAPPATTAARPPFATEENKQENTIGEGEGNHKGKRAGTAAAGAAAMGQGLESKDEADDDGDDFLLVDLGLDGVNSWGWSSLPKLVPKKKQPETQLPTVLDWDCWPEGNNDHGGGAGPKAANRASPAATSGRASTQGGSAHPGASPGTATPASRSAAKARAQASRACRHWVAFGKCSYGLNCRYSHTMPETRQVFEFMNLSGPPQWWIRQQGLKAGAGKTGLGDGDDGDEMGGSGGGGDNGSVGGVHMKGRQTPSPKREKKNRSKKKGNGSGKGNSRAAATTVQPKTKLQTPTQMQTQAQAQSTGAETTAAPASPAAPVPSARPALLLMPAPQAPAPAPAYAPAGKGPSPRLSAAGGPAYGGIREVTNLVEL